MRYIKGARYPRSTDTEGVCCDVFDDFQIIVAIQVVQVCQMLGDDLVIEPDLGLDSTAYNSHVSTVTTWRRTTPVVHWVCTYKNLLAILCPQVDARVPFAPIRAVAELNVLELSRELQEEVAKPNKVTPIVNSLRVESERHTVVLQTDLTARQCEQGG